jgi:hypothetical protein
MNGMQPQKKSPYAVAIVFALLIAGSALVYKFSFGQSSHLPKTVIELGKAGSAHAHISMLMFVGGTAVNFCEQRFMLRSQFVHFEDNNCRVIHKHATGVTLPIFFKTIGVELTETCMKLPFNDEQHCADDVNHLRVVVNGVEVSIPDLSYYELRNNDHVLVNYGVEEGGMLRLKYNQVPPIPFDIYEASPAKTE